MNKKLTSMLATSLIVTATLTGCSLFNTTEDTSSISATNFIETSFKIKSQITLLRTNKILNFECYIDNNGNGEGLLKYNDVVYNVGICDNSVYLILSESLTVCLTDINGHFVSPSSLTNFNENNEFVITNDDIVGYKYKTDTISINNSYASSSNVFEEKAYSTDRNVTTETLVNLLENKEKETEKPVVSQKEEPVKEEEEKEEEEKNEVEDTSIDSFYNQFDTGVIINNQVFSIGDVCLPSTYYFNTVPEGITKNVEYSEDNEVDVVYVSYLSKDGKTTFAMVDNIVRSIYTTTNFKWCGIYKGMPAEELDAYCGEGLSEKEIMETGFKISFDGLNYLNKKSKTYYFEIDDLQAEVSLDGDNNVFDIYVKKTLEYENYESE